MAKYSERDERITLKFNSEEELNKFLNILSPRTKYEIVPYEGNDKYLKITKYSYLKAIKDERK